MTESVLSFEEKIQYDLDLPSFKLPASTKYHLRLTR